MVTLTLTALAVVIGLFPFLVLGAYALRAPSWKNTVARMQRHQ